MKITHITNIQELPNQRMRIFVVAPGNEEYEKFYGYYKIAKRIKENEIMQTI